MKGQRKARQGIVSRLRAGQTVGEGADLATYPDGGYFVVGLLPEGPVDMQGLTNEQARQLADDGELSEYLDTPEEAADLYLKLKKEYGSALARLGDTPPAASPATATPEPTCGSPELAQASSRMLAFNGANFGQEVLASSFPVLVFFCQSLSACDRLMLPLLERLAGDHTGIRFGRVEVGQNDPLAVKYGVDTVPACLLFKHSRLIQTLKGLQPERTLRAALDALLA
jgi:thioredoxin 1